MRSVVLFTALLLACGLIVVQAVQNRELREQQILLIGEMAKPQVGAWLPTMQARTLAGKHVTLGRPSSDRQILYFFEPWCPSCRASIPAIRSIQSAIAGHPDAVEIVGVSRSSEDELRTYLAENDLDFPVSKAATSGIGVLFDLKSVPLLLVVDRDSKVVYSHSGTLDTKEQVEQVLAAALAMDRPVAVQPKGRSK